MSSQQEVKEVTRRQFLRGAAAGGVAAVAKMLGGTPRIEASPNAEIPLVPEEARDILRADQKIPSSTCVILPHLRLPQDLTKGDLNIHTDTWLTTLYRFGVGRWGDFIGTDRPTAERTGALGQYDRESDRRAEYLRILLMRELELNDVNLNQARVLNPWNPGEVIIDREMVNEGVNLGWPSLFEVATVPLKIITQERAAKMLGGATAEPGVVFEYHEKYQTVSRILRMYFYKHERDGSVRHPDTDDFYGIVSGGVKVVRTSFSPERVHVRSYDARFNLIEMPAKKGDKKGIVRVMYDIGTLIDHRQRVDQNIPEDLIACGNVIAAVFIPGITPGVPPEGPPDGPPPPPPPPPAEECGEKGSEDGPQTDPEDRGEDQTTGDDGGEGTR